jgi:hypothetical protein
MKTLGRLKKSSAMDALTASKNQAQRQIQRLPSPTV